MVEFCIKCLKSEKTDLGITYGQFLINSLKPGQGLTISTLLRRVLLGDLVGTAITEVDIEGATHEFAVLDGVREDILEILLNLKGIIVKSINNNTKFGELNIQGPAIITANCINLEEGLEIINPNHYIASISENSELKIKFKFERGIGYKLANHTITEKISNFLEIDSIFMPVTKVDVKIENNFTDLNSNTENIILDIWTNGSLTPHEALHQASKKILEIFNQIISNKIEDIVPSSEIKVKEVKKEAHIDISIEELQLSARSYNCLKRIKIDSVSDLLQYSPEKLLEVRNFGQKSADEVLSALKTKLGITFN